MIKIDNVSVVKDELSILQNINLHVGRGESVVLTGPSGSGKSSLLKVIVGALPRSAGAVSVDGVMLSPESAQAIRSKIAFIGQEPLMGADIVRDALLLPFTFSVHEEALPSDAYISELLLSVGLDPSILGKKSASISSGQKQRIAVLRAIILGKRIIVADEFTSALDPESKQQVMKLLLDGSKTILSVSHDYEWIELCSRKIEVVGGQINGGSQ